MRHSYFFIVLLLSISSANLFSKSLDDRTYDSLQTVWLNVSEADSNRLDAVHKMIWGRQLFSNPDTALVLASLQLELAQKSNNKKYESKAINTMGMVARTAGDLVGAIEYFQKALEIRLETGDKRGAANTINNIGIIHHDQGQYAKAIENYTQSLKLQEEIENDAGIANALTNIGVVHHATMKYDQSLPYFEKAKTIRQKMEDKRGLGNIYSNIGMIYLEKQSYSEALTYFKQAMAIQEEIHDELNLGITLNKIAMVYYYQGNYDEALIQEMRSIEVSSKANYQKGIIEGLTNLSKIYRVQKKYSKSLENALSAYNMAVELGQTFFVQISSKLLYEAYKETGEFSEALKYHEVFKLVGDSLVNIKTSKKILSQEFAYEYDKKEAIKDAERDKKIAISSEREEKQRAVSYAVGTGLIIVLILSVLLYMRLKLTTRQKILIEVQNTDIIAGSEKILRIEKENHELELAQKQRDLEMVYANNHIKLAVKKSLIEELSDLVKRTNPMAEIKTLLFEMKQQVISEDKIQSMHDNMNVVDSKFLELLHEKFPQLTKTEREMCGYIKLNLTIKEIASFRRSSENSIAAVRSRIRAKMGLTREGNLEAFIQNI